PEAVPGEPSALSFPTSASISDPTGDDGDAFDPRGDITHATMSDDGTTVRLTVNTLVFDDPSTSDNWFSNLTSVGWFFDTNGDNFADYVAIMFNDQPDVVGFVGLINANDPSCQTSVSWSAANKSYSMSFPARCIDSPKSMTGEALTEYETATDDS